jgi:hypothetical protein
MNRLKTAQPVPPSRALHQADREWMDVHRVHTPHRLDQASCGQREASGSTAEVHDHHARPDSDLSEDPLRGAKEVPQPKLQRHQPKPSVVLHPASLQAAYSSEEFALLPPPVPQEARNLGSPTSRADSNAERSAMRHRGPPPRAGMQLSSLHSWPRGSCLASIGVSDQCVFKHSSRSLPLKPFSLAAASGRGPSRRARAPRR